MELIGCVSQKINGGPTSEKLPVPNILVWEVGNPKPVFRKKHFANLTKVQFRNKRSTYHLKVAIKGIEVLSSHEQIVIFDGFPIGS